MSMTKMEVCTAMDKFSLAAKHYLGLSIQELEKVEFIECFDPHNSLSVDGTIVVFKEPIYLAPGIRLCPIYPNIGVSEDGTLYDRFSLEELKIYYPTDKRVYPKTSNSWSRRFGPVFCSVHRAIASAWVVNPDPITRDEVNHINGVKTDNSPGNHEWVTSQGNAEHAWRMKLINRKEGCVVNDLLEKRVITFDSLAEAGRYMGAASGAVTYQLARRDNFPKIIKQRYEVRHIDDDTPWMISSIADIPTGSKHRVDVRFPDGTEKVYWNAEQFYTEYTGLTGAMSASSRIEKVKNLRPELEITLTERSPVKELEILNTDTNEIVTTSNVGEVVKLIGKSEAFVRKIVSTGFAAVSRNFIIRIKCDQPWTRPIPKGLHDFKAKITRESNGEVRYFESLVSISEYTGIPGASIRRHLYAGSSFRGYQFELLESD